MHDYRDLVGEHFGRAGFIPNVSSTWYDPFQNGEGAETRSPAREVSPFSTELGTSIFYPYNNGRNNITVRAAGRRESNGVLRQRSQGLSWDSSASCCQPTSPRRRQHRIAPLQPLDSDSVGHRVPVVFLSLNGSIIALGDNNTLNSLDTKIIIHLPLVACFLATLR